MQAASLISPISSSHAERGAASADPLGSTSMVAHNKQYRVLEQIGEGGMGFVYRAYDAVLDRQVALKVMKPDVPAHQRERFRQEAIYGARFCHPSIARVFDLVGVPGQGISWFVMEFLPGKDVGAVADRAKLRGRSIPLRLVADVFRQALAALQYAHDCGVVHRDVKPENIFITRDPNTNFVTTKLLDFGVAQQRGNEAEAGRVMVGDPRYMAPEQARPGSHVSHRADLYAAGMTLYEVLAGEHPFDDLIDEGASARELIAAHRERFVRPVSCYLPNETPVTVACGLDVIVEKALSKDEADRFDSAADMSAALLDVLAPMR